MSIKLFRLIVYDLNSARKFLKNYQDSDVELINPEGSIKYYGILIINYIFTKLREEFSCVKKITYNLENDPVAEDAAKKLGIIVSNY